MSLRPLAFVLLLTAPFALRAQTFSTQPCAGNDDQGISRWFSSGARACEVRQSTLQLVNGKVNVEGFNGSIEVIGEARQDVWLEAKVNAQGGSEQEAQSMLREITIDTQGTIHARGPRPTSGHGWSVSFRLRVPHQIAATLKTENGSLSLSNLQGSIEGTTTNGSLKFNGLGGDVRATTTNGSISAVLDGSGWQGGGLSATTTNGGISVTTPSNYSAHLIASTTNGGVSVSLPDATRTHGRNVDMQLGKGGATLIFQTTNGGVSVKQ